MPKRTINFTDIAWKDYKGWQTENAKIVKQINKLIEAIQREPFKGIGKPEPLKGNLSGFWSRRITSADRIVYQITDSQINIVSCRYHYSK
ncbi:Txe/YoeB family addiction module toxin [Agarivorans sp. Toyoura001]|uniref:Txe/YoeB family addiction module toxin n=1 Tax=unclassified Agarivorans TaxID=2636026 RepID=UPI0010E0EE57|nr:Txe/YoeB family addiction module toxin [Agarivorans sp. Toyoura001]GDY28003.1 hypothetical protein AHAT_38930 [Agarivorans sp. Toyoura001]